MSILRAKGQEIQEEWDLGVKAACLAYNTTMHTSTGQTPFFAMFGQEAMLSVNWIYPVPKADRKMELSDWTEVMQVDSRWLMLVSEKNNKLQFVGMLNSTSQSCQSLKLVIGSGSLIQGLYLEAVIS